MNCNYGQPYCFRNNAEQKSAPKDACHLSPLIENPKESHSDLMAPGWNCEAKHRVKTLKAMRWLTAKEEWAVFRGWWLCGVLAMFNFLNLAAFAQSVHIMLIYKPVHFFFNINIWLYFKYLTYSKNITKVMKLIKLCGAGPLFTSLLCTFQ